MALDGTAWGGLHAVVAPSSRARHGAALHHKVVRFVACTSIQCAMFLNAAFSFDVHSTETCPCPGSVGNMGSFRPHHCQCSGISSPDTEETLGS